MISLLAEVTGFDFAELAQKIGLVGVLGFAVWALWRARENERAKRDVVTDQAIADGQKVEKEYIEARARWTAAIEGMAENDKSMAELQREMSERQKELLDELRGVRQQLDDHESRCTGRR